MRRLGGFILLLLVILRYFRGEVVCVATRDTIVIWRLLLPL